MRWLIFKVDTSELESWFDRNNYSLEGYGELAWIVLCLYVI